MRRCAATVAGLALIALVAPAAAQEPRIELRYPYGPDSFRQDGVPRGTVTEHVWKDSKIFPGTIRRYYVYVPARIRPTSAASLSRRFGRRRWLEPD